jgi:hypothetical protein
MDNFEPIPPVAVSFPLCLKQIAMDNQLVIHLKTGHKIEGRLARSFSNNDIDVGIYIAEEQRQLFFALDEICAVRFKKIPPWALSDRPAKIEDVRTIAGETFRVAVFPDRKFLKGFISIDPNEAAPYRTIFFTFSGVRCRNAVRRVGEILQAKSSSRVLTNRSHAPSIHGTHNGAFTLSRSPEISSDPEDFLFG